jgi:hypothetical protein
VLIHTGLLKELSIRSARAVSDHRESVLIWIPKMLRMSESVRDNRFAGTGCLAPILLIYESVLSAR